ncbi:MAG: succinate dehydrogenase assembly factor 2 [Gallionella sp.]
MKHLERVRWRARRGLLELDIIFERFISAHYAELTLEEKQLFEVILDMPDNPLLDQIMGRSEAASWAQKVLLEKISAASCRINMGEFEDGK